MSWEGREWRGSEEGGEMRGDEVCWVFVGDVRGAQCLSVCEDGRLVMSWLAGPKAHRACEGVTWLGHRGVSLALFYWIRLWQGAAPHPATTETQPANHSVLLNKSACISSLKWNDHFLAFCLYWTAWYWQEIQYRETCNKGPCQNWTGDVAFIQHGACLNPKATGRPKMKWSWFKWCDYFI